MNEIKIEKGIPIPTTNGRHFGLTATLKKMKVGDSIVIPRKQQQSIAAIKRGLGTLIITRKISDHEVRVWRVK